MSTVARLAAFVAGLVLVFGASFAAGAAFGPEPADDAPTEQHTDHPAELE